MYYLGIDLGTSSLKILLADENGSILDSEAKSYGLSFPGPGQVEQDPADWYEALVYTIHSLGKRYDLSKIDGVSFSGQMHGSVILDKEDNVLRPVIMWNDSRTRRECRYLNDTVGKDKLIEWTGNIAFTGFTAPKILWIKENEPDIFARIDKIMVPKDYLIYKMTGVFASDVSDSSGTLYYDVKNGCWSKPMLDILGINESQLPEVHQSYEVVGNICESFAKETGMSQKTRVIAGGGDQAVGAVGTGTVGDGHLSISLGTSGVIFSSNAQFAKISSGAMHSFRHADGKFHVMAVVLSAAGSNDWWVKQILETSDYVSVDKGAEKANAEGLIFLPYLTGERSPINDPEAKGVFYGLTMAHKRDDMSRAILEGINFALLDCYKGMQEAGTKADHARVIGGGAKSGIWLQMLSDTLGLELRTINTSEGGGLGAIILAMTGCKKFGSVEEGCRKLIRDVKTYVPDKDKIQSYEKKYRKFKELYERLEGFSV